MILNEVKEILMDVLQIPEQCFSMSEKTVLVGGIPEFDSMAVVSVITALEERYGFTVEDEEISAEVFATLGSLAQFVEEKMNS